MINPEDRTFLEEMRRLKMAEIAAIEERLGYPAEKRLAHLRRTEHINQRNGANQAPIGDNVATPNR